MVNLIFKRLECIDKEVGETKAELKKTVEQLRKDSKNTLLHSERERLVKELSDLNDRRKNLENKLSGSLPLGTGAAETEVGPRNTGAGANSSGTDAGGAAARPWTNAAVNSAGCAVESIFFPAQAYFVAFQVFNNSSVALRLASHALAVIACGQVSHTSLLRSDFTLLFPGNNDGQQRMLGFLHYLKNTTISSNMKVLRAGAGTEVGDEEAVVRFMAGGEGQISQDAQHLRMLESSLDVRYATSQLQLSMERKQVHEEHQALARSHSLGRSSESSAAEG